MPPVGIHGRGGRFLTEEEKNSQPKVTKELLARIFGQLRPYLRELALALVCVAASSVLALYPSVLTGRIIDEGLIGRDSGALVRLIGLSFAVTFAANLIGVLESWLNAWISQHVTFDLRNRMFRHLERMPQKFFTSTSQGEIITRMTSDIDGVESIIANTFTSILSNGITLIAAITAMMHKNVIMAFVGMLVIPLFVIPTRKAGKTRWSLTREAQDCNDRINGILGETMSVSGQLLVKLFGKEEYEYNRYAQENRRMIDYNIRERMAGRWFRVAMSTFSSIGPMLIYLAGGILLLRGDSTLTVGDISVLVLLLGKMYGPVNQLLNIQVDWIRSMALFTRIFSYLDMPVEIEAAPDAIIPDINASAAMNCAGTTADTSAPMDCADSLPDASAAIGSPDTKRDACTAMNCAGTLPDASAAMNCTGTLPDAVRFEHVFFSYEKNKPVLQDVSFSLPHGRSIAIVGPSGAGKSTIVSLVPRLYDVCDGSVLVDGVDVRKLDPEWLRGNVGIVTQDTYLFNGTIRDNLLYAKMDATEDELIDVCKKANIYEMIRRLPAGFDTVVGNRGLELSGGERQRISIARVLLKDPAILIFDEATSALDSISEASIQKAIDPLVRSRTSILIAHRLSTILAADEILVLKDGRIAQHGTHLELLAAGGVYSELYETQFGRAASAGAA